MQISKVFTSTLGKKYLLGITGLFWVLFVIMHLIGNLALYYDPVAFNKYTYLLTENLKGLVYFMEAVLVISLLLHIGYAIVATLQNRKARPSRYAVHKSAGVAQRRKGFATASMIWTGILLAVFLVLHINNFKFGPVHYTEIDGQQMRDLYKTVYDYYQSPLNVAYYVIMMVLLGTHLSHGFWSGFQSLGLFGKKFTPLMYTLGTILAIALAAGFIGIPIYMYII